jgi:hypothetical protein
LPLAHRVAPNAAVAHCGQQHRFGTAAKLIDADREKATQLSTCQTRTAT